MNAIRYLRTANGIQFNVRVTPSARKPHCGGIHDGCLKVAVAAPADKGRANEAVLAMLAEFFGVAKSDFTITSGQAQRRKVVVFQGAKAEMIERILAEME